MRRTCSQHFSGLVSGDFESISFLKSELAPRVGFGLLATVFIFIYADAPLQQRRKPKRYKN
jgi:hypothetical protein